MLNKKQANGKHILPLFVCGAASEIYLGVLEVGKTPSLQKIVVP